MSEYCENAGVYGGGLKTKKWAVLVNRLQVNATSRCRRSVIKWRLKIVLAIQLDTHIFVIYKLK